MGGRLRPCSILGGPSVLGLPVDCGRIKDCTGIAVGFWIGILQSCRNGTTDGPPGLALFYIWRAVGSPIAVDCTRILELCEDCMDFMSTLLRFDMSTRVVYRP